ncbi:MAG: hypothetical protein CMC45_02970 [Flavobacteriaceae bacterium]|nr:hypothetical protein [Flavobacteriaceae bacterium]
MNMKTIYKLLGSLFLIFFLVGCDEDFSDNTDFASSVVPPSNVSAAFIVTQDNTGQVTITPSADNAMSFVVDYGDGSEPSSSFNVGGSVQHTYTEGSYTVKVTAKGLNNLTATGDVPLTVSFKAPENLVVEILNSETISKLVNVTATADFATMYEFHPGIAGVDPVTANIGDALTYQYAEAGTYNIKVVAKGAAIAVTEFAQEFEVTAIMAPVVSAPDQPSRNINDVVSIYSSKYTDLSGTDFYPNWGQTTSYNEFDLNGDKMIQYAKLNYQGVQFAAAQNVSNMQYLHMDVWTADLEALEIFPISVGSGEKSVTKTLTKDEWTTIEIPISDFTDQGLDMSDIHQFKFVGSPWNAGGFGTVFIDNIYFYKNPSQPTPLAGKWQVKKVAGALKVGPAKGNGDWWQSSADDVTGRACFFDDDFIFNSDGSFQISMGDQTWVEAWQGASADGCAAPVAPHDGAGTYSFVHDQSTNTVTLIGKGSFIGIPKATNNGELSSNDNVPVTRSYGVELSSDGNTATFAIEFAAGAWWTFQLERKTVSPVQLMGVWQLAQEAYAVKVGPAFDNGDWWGSSADDLTTRSCFFDDSYVFGKDGSFANLMGGSTWVEAWQGASADGCATPVAPHDGSGNATATYNYDPVNETVTLNGVGAHIGVPKATNNGELSNPADAPSSVTYKIVYIDANTALLGVEFASGAWWNAKIVKVSQKIDGTWKMAPEAGALKVGPAPNNGDWWQSSADDVTTRACYFDDEYIFNSDGTFTIKMQDQTWVEAWQGVAADGCATPVDPHVSGSHTFLYDDVSGKIMLDGVGAFIGLPKATNNGEIGNNADAPASRTYNVSFIDDNTISVTIEFAAGAWWSFKLVK